MAIAAEIYVAVLFLNHGTNGWSERWPLLASTAASAHAATLKLVEARSMILCKHHVIEWACVRHYPFPVWEWAAIDAPVEPLPQWDVNHADWVGLLWNFDTGLGHVSQHLFRAIQDDEITDNQWVRRPFWLPVVTIPRPADPTVASKEDLFKYCFGMFRDLCAHVEKVDDFDPDAPLWHVRPFADAHYRKVGTRKVGQNYVRISAEPREWDYAPDFSFCGTVAGVQRLCRDVDCRYYVNGPVQGIRFYNAGPDAVVFPHPHIFWGSYRDMDLANGLLPGEIKGAQRTFLNPNGKWEWTSGLAAGAAPGAAWTGTPEQFLGLTPKPWADSADDDPHFGPECDMPVVATIRVKLDDNSVNLPDAFTITFDHLLVDAEITGLHEIFIAPKIRQLRDIHSWRQPRGLLLNRRYAAGQVTNTNWDEREVEFDTLLAVPIFCPTGATLDSLSIHVATGSPSGQLARLGIYRATAQMDLWPSQLVFASDPIDLTTAGSKVVPVTVELSPEYLHWATIVVDEVSEPALLMCQDSIDYFQIWGYPDDDLSGLCGIAHTVPFPLGPLPDPFPDVASSTIITDLWVPKIGILFAEFGGGAGVLPTVTGGTFDAGTWL